MEDKILNLIDRFENSDLTVMKIENDDFKLHLEKGNGQAPAQIAPIIQTPVAVPMQAGQIQASPMQANPMQAGQSISSPAQAATTEMTENSYEKVKSPIVGVFYEAPSPEDAPYVKLGDKVTKGQVLCLVEAMKMMNELKSPVDGIIKTINGKNGELVEFDQILFEVEEC